VIVGVLGEAPLCRIALGAFSFFFKACDGLGLVLILTLICFFCCRYDLADVDIPL
jgi:hypothetical protein